MLGSDKLTTIFGAPREGSNTAGVNVLKSLLHGYADAGLAVMFLTPGTKTPADYRTDKQKKEAEEEAAVTGERPRAGFHLATSEKKLLTQYLTAARKQADGPDADPNAIGGLTPINFGIVPDKSGLVVVDCDTLDETNAFRNWVMDHTQDNNLYYNVDMMRPSVISPGSIRDGRWEVVQEDFIEDDYDTQVYHPTVYQNHGGEVVHSQGGHWYFFYPEGYTLPDNAPSKITVVYDSVSRTEKMERLRQLRDEYHYYVNEPEKQAAVAQEAENIKAELARIKEQATYYFDNPEQARDDKGGLKEGFSTFVIMLRKCYILIPPSSRKEGHYRVGSGDLPWEPWLDALISGQDLEDHVEEKPQESFAPPIAPLAPSPAISSVSRDNEVDAFADFTSSDRETVNEIIRQWAWPTRWSSLLMPHGWVRTGIDSCGCEIYQAPGPHDSPKSATAHDRGCELGTDDLGTLHIWTDRPPAEFEEYVRRGKRGFSKMTVNSLLNYGDNMRDAILGEGLELPAIETDTEYDLGFNDFLQVEFFDRNVEVILQKDEARAYNKKVELIDIADLKDMEPPRFLVEDTIEEKSFAAMIGPSGAGKSFVAIDMACSIASGGRWMGKKCRKRKVAYFPGEGYRGAVRRIVGWQLAHGIDLSGDIYVASFLPNLNQYSHTEFNELAALIKSYDVDLVIIDTWSRAIAGADENAAEDTSRTIGTINQMQSEADCGVLVIHHTAKDSTHARGSSAFNAALDTEILVRKADDPDKELDRRLISVEVTKQKNDEEWQDARYCQILKHGEDTLDFDEEGMPIKGLAPAVVADLKGEFVPDDGFGGSWLLDEGQMSRPRPDLPSALIILNEINAVAHEWRQLGITFAKIVSSVTAVLKTGQYAGFEAELKREVERLTNAAIQHRMIVHKPNSTSKFTVPRKNMKSKTPEELVEYLSNPVELDEESTED